MYWDGEKQNYIPAAAGQSNTEGAPMSAASSDSLFAPPGNKEKKDKPKNKTAQQVCYILDTSIRYFWMKILMSGQRLLIECMHLPAGGSSSEKRKSFNKVKKGKVSPEGI